MKSFEIYFCEKNILGLIEDIDIEGLGRVSAKLDTGNGAFNVLHGDNINIKNNMVKFTTMGGIQMEKPIKDTIIINVGAGNKEERPVVLFNVKIGGKEFPNIPFSIGNRSDNDHKVLVGKTFIQDQLDALIDVGLKNVSDQGIEVEY